MGCNTNSDTKKILCRLILQELINLKSNSWKYKMPIHKVNILVKFARPSVYVHLIEEWKNELREMKH